MLALLAREFKPNILTSQACLHNYNLMQTCLSQSESAYCLIMLAIYYDRQKTKGHGEQM